MHTSFVTAILAACSLVSAAPLAKRQKQDIDATILNYALTLEHLEAAFYKQGLDKYSAYDFKCAGYDYFVRERITEIASHEVTHVEYLTSGLKAAGATPVEACTYKFPDTDVKSFLAVSQILEGVGVSAYLGAAASITNPDYLTAAGSILTVEARHSAFIRSANKGDPFPAPFDTPLDFNEVYSLAAPFFASCPSSNPALPVKAFPSLTLETTGAIKSGQEITLKYDNKTSGQYAVFLSELSQTAVAISSGKVKVPQNNFGQLYVVITSANQTVSDDIVVAGPAVVEVDIPAKNFEY